MNLKSRLSRLRTQAGSGIASRARKPTVSDLRARIVQLEKRRPGKKGLAPAGARRTPSNTLALSGMNQPSDTIDRGQRADCVGNVIRAVGKAQKRGRKNQRDSKKAINARLAVFHLGGVAARTTATTGSSSRRCWCHCFCSST